MAFRCIGGRVAALAARGLVHWEKLGRVKGKEFTIDLLGTSHGYECGFGYSGEIELGANDAHYAPRGRHKD